MFLILFVFCWSCPFGGVIAWVWYFICCCFYGDLKFNLGLAYRLLIRDPDSLRRAGNGEDEVDLLESGEIRAGR
jgi:hypothetical protein